MMKLRTLVFAAVASLAIAAPSFAQWQVPDNAVPLGRGGGNVGFKNVPPGTVDYVWTSNGPGVAPSYKALPTFGTVTSITLQGGVQSTPNPITTAGTINADANYAGFATQNCNLTASVGSNTLTVALKNTGGTDPTAAEPCNINYRSATSSSGTTAAVPQTAALSINTVAAGATLGSSNGVAFRFWVVVFNNSGTNVLGLINCSTATTIYPLNEGVAASSTSISAGATSAGTFYTTSGTTVSAKAFRILGYIEYASGLGTAGTYDIVPTTIQIFGPGIKKPGDIVQDIYNQTGTVQTTSNTYTLSATSPTPAGGVLVVSQAITPTARANKFRITAQTTISPSTSGGVSAFIYDTTNAATRSVAGSFASTGFVSTVPVSYETLPPSASATTYSLYGTGGVANVTINGVGGVQFFGTISNSFIRIQEIMG